MKLKRQVKKLKKNTKRAYLELVDEIEELRENQAYLLSSVTALCIKSEVQVVKELNGDIRVVPAPSSLPSGN